MGSLQNRRFCGVKWNPASATIKNSIRKDAVFLLYPQDLKRGEIDKNRQRPERTALRPFMLSEDFDGGDQLQDFGIDLVPSIGIEKTGGIAVGLQIKAQRPQGPEEVLG